MFEGLKFITVKDTLTAINPLQHPPPIVLLFLSQFWKTSLCLLVAALVS